jgi:hypothetical protein
MVVSVWLTTPLGSIWAFGHKLVFGDGLCYFKVTYLIVVSFWKSIKCSIMKENT